MRHRWLIALAAVFGLVVVVAALLPWMRLSVHVPSPGSTTAQVGVLEMRGIEGPAAMGASSRSRSACSASL